MDFDRERIVIISSNGEKFKESVQKLCDNYKLVCELSTNLKSDNYSIVKVTKDTGMKAHQMMNIIIEEQDPEISNCNMITKEEYRIMTS